MLQNKKNIETLNRYRGELDIIRYFYKKNRILNKYQIERLDYFLSRASQYCDTRKVVNYEKTKYKKSSRLIATREQIEEYTDIYKMFVKVKNQIINDKQLKQKYRNQLVRCLSYVQGHLIGKIYKRRPA